MGNIKQTYTVEAATLLVVLAGSLSFDVARAAEEEKRAGLAAIQISFKLDPRLTDSTYGGERWVSPRTYTGANAPDQGARGYTKGDGSWVI